MSLGALRAPSLAPLLDPAHPYHVRAAFVVALPCWLWGCGAAPVPLVPAVTETACAGLVQCVEACNEGSTSACNEAGRAYELGQGVPRSGVNANTYYRRACDLGDPAGCYNAGYLLESGQAGRRDVGCALALYRQACEAGHPRSCLSAGLILRDGAAEVTPDAQRAAEYLRKACDAGNPTACQESAKAPKTP